MSSKPEWWNGPDQAPKPVSRVDEDDGVNRSERIRARLEVWNPVSMLWERMTQPGGGGGGGAVTIADGADVVEGALADAAVTTDAAGTVSGKLRGLVKWAYERMPASLGQKTMANSFPVVVASDQSAIPVSGTVSVTEPVSVDDNGGSLTVDTPQLPAALVGGRLDSNNGAWLGSTAPTVGQKTAANSLPVVLASDQSAVPVTGPLTDTQLRTTPVPISGTVTITDGSGPVTVDGTVTANPTRPGTGVLTEVAGTVSEGILLAANAARLGATLYNDSTATLYVGLGTEIVNANNFTVKLFQDDYIELPYGFTGQVRGVWASATGEVLITEFT